MSSIGKLYEGEMVGEVSMGSAPSRKHLHIKVSRSDGEICVPVYLHVEQEHLEWFEDDESVIIGEVIDRVAFNIGEIESFFHENSPPPSKVTTTPNYGISGIKRIGARSDIILSYAVRRRKRDDYAILLSDLNEANLSSFSLYLWVKPSAAALASHAHLNITHSTSRVKRS